MLAFPRSDYARVFEAALESARADGLQPVVVDQELGVIETDARITGSVVQPWRTDDDGIQDLLAHTVNFERRRARFEFVPEVFDLPTPTADQRSIAAALPGSLRADARLDLLQVTGTIEMRAWVYVDRGFMPNQRIGRWTLQETTYSRDPSEVQDSQDESTRIPTEWTPIGRDVPYEQRLMRRIREELDRPAPAVVTRKPLDPGGTDPIAPTGAPAATTTTPGTDPVR